MLLRWEAVELGRQPQVCLTLTPAFPLALDQDLTLKACWK